MDELCRVVLWKPTAEHDPRSGLSEIVVQQIAPNYATYAEKLAAGADSVLAQLSPADFRAGINAMRAHGSDKPVCEPIDVFVFR